MNATEISNILDGYGKLTSAVEKVLELNKTLIDEDDRWLRSPWACEIDNLEVNTRDQTLVGYAYVWTNQTGGSNEQVNFTIPLDTLRKFLEPNEKSEYQLKGEESLKELNLEARILSLETKSKESSAYIDLIGQILNVLLDSTYGVGNDDVPESIKTAFERYYAR